MLNLPFFFPTRVVLIDDEPQVLRLTALLFAQMPQVTDVQVFDDAQTALDWLHASAPPMPAPDPFATARVEDEHHGLDASAAGPLRRAVHIDLRRLDAVMTVPEVTQQVSVIVCDYAMPGMDGLTFFERLPDPQVRRVMLTALCDEHRAVQAFNRGLIHQFVRKADPAGPRGLEAVLRAQQRAWFAARTGPLAAALSLGADAQVLQHPAVEQVRDAALRERRADRFVASLAPAGYRLAGRDARGGAARLMLADGARFEQAARAVDEVDGPPDLAEALRARSAMPWTRAGAPILDLLDLPAGPERQAQLVPPRVAGDTEPLYWALVDETA